MPVDTAREHFDEHHRRCAPLQRSVRFRRLLLGWNDVGAYVDPVYRHRGATAERTPTYSPFFACSSDFVRNDRRRSLCLIDCLIMPRFVRIALAHRLKKCIACSRVMCGGSVGNVRRSSIASSTTGRSAFNALLPRFVNSIRRVHANALEAQRLAELRVGEVGKRLRLHVARRARQDALFPGHLVQSELLSTKKDQARIAPASSSICAR